jgi:hypothetical protein
LRKALPLTAPEYSEDFSQIFAEIDRLIGPEKIPQDLSTPAAIGADWIHPNDPRLPLARAAVTEPAE